MSRKTLLIACGGSGIRTLMRFNEMMASNDEWRVRLPNDIAYLIIDTELDLTETFKAQVASQMGNIGESGMPLIHLIQITKGLNDIGQIVDKAFEGHESSPAHARLHPNWWYNPDGHTPFRAQFIKDIVAGAGQCCPVSYLCTWKDLSTPNKIFDNELEAILNELKRRNMHEEKPLDNMRVYFVAGLAGGTGRGAWMPAAFKVRRYLEDRGYEVNPSGIFFERGCFPNVGTNDKDQDLRLKVNTMTGLSELSAWMRILEGEDYYFSLPDLFKPGIDPNNPSGSADTDVIRVPPGVRDTFKRSPLNSAYLICEDAGHGCLENNMQYHEMAAAALYTLVASSQIIGATAINKLKNFGSLGASTFEVSTVPIKAYSEAFLRKAAVEAVCKKSVKGDALAAEADELLKKIADPNEEHPLLGLSQFALTGAVGPNDIAAATGATSLVARVIAEIRANTQNVQQNFTAQMKLQKPKVAWAFVTKTLSLSDLTKDKASAAIDAVLARLGIADLGASLRELVETAYSDGKKNKASFGRALAVINKMEARLKDANTHLDDRIVFGKDSYQTDKDLVAKFKIEFDEKAKRNTAKEKVFFINFTASEQDYLAKKFSWLYNCAIFFKLRPLLKKRFDEALDSLGKVKEACAMLSKALAKVQRTFDKNVDEVVGAKRGEAYSKLFTKPTVKAMLEDIPLDASPQMMYKRILKPIMSEEDVKALLLAENDGSIRYKSINESVLAELKKLLAFDKEPEADYVAELEKSMEETFRKNVFLGGDFMDTNFSFKHVLDNNIPHWNDLIADICGNMHEYEDLRRRLQDYIGVDLANAEHVEEAGIIPPKIRVDGIVERIALSMVDTCRPWVQLDDSVSLKDLETIVLLPTSLFANQMQAMQDNVARFHESQNVSVFHHGSTSISNCKLPQDRILVFASQCISSEDEDAEGNGGPHALDLIRSISNMWKEPTVKEALEIAEKPDASAYFRFDKKGNVFKERRVGLGFVSPIYVNEPLLSTTRWRPWLTEPTVDDVETLTSSVDKALLYAFIGMEAKAEAASILADVSARFGWGLPLLAMGKGKSENFTFTREPLVWKNGRGEEDVLPMWQTDETVITSIDNLYAYLMGRGKPGLEGSKLAKAQEDGAKQLAHMLSEADVFAAKIVPSIGTVALEKLRNARNKWLTARARTASKEDKPFWERLQAAAKSQ